MPSIDHFSSEVAQEWLVDFAANDFRLIERTLAGVAAMQPVDRLDQEEVQEVLVAAECVAAAAGIPTAVLPPLVANWLHDNHPIQLKPAYIHMAQTAVAHVLNQSDLTPLWNQSAAYAAWHTAVCDLQHRLHACTPKSE